jgi:hypothetical protein
MAWPRLPRPSRDRPGWAGTSRLGRASPDHPTVRIHGTSPTLTGPRHPVTVTETACKSRGFPGRPGASRSPYYGTSLSLRLVLA